MSRSLVAAWAQRHRVGRGGLALVLLALGFDGVAVDPEYLRAIQRDAQPSGSTRPAVPGDAREISESRAQFEQRLKEAYPGSFSLYKRLPGDRQDVVYREYEAAGNLDQVRARVVELSR
jgi:hypothetical protein